MKLESDSEDDDNEDESPVAAHDNEEAIRKRKQIDEDLRNMMDMDDGTCPELQFFASNTNRWYRRKGGRGTSPTIQKINSYTTSPTRRGVRRTW
jgi:hypothetical protein